MAWFLREGLQKGKVSFRRDLPYLDRLIAELSAFRYGYDASARLVLLKDKTKKLFGHSPDLRDSAVMGYAATSWALKPYQLPPDYHLVVEELQSPSQWAIGGSVWGGDEDAARFG